MKTNNYETCNTNTKPQCLLWSDGVIRRVLKEVIDIVVINLNVRDKHTVTTILINACGLARLLWADHVSKLWVSLLSEKRNLIHNMSHTVTEQICNYLDLKKCKSTGFKWVND